MSSESVCIYDKYVNKLYAVYSVCYYTYIIQLQIILSLTLKLCNDILMLSKIADGESSIL